MIPEYTPVDIQENELSSQAHNTYKLHREEKRINGTISGREAMEQAIWLMLQTERFEHIIYDWDYGIGIQPLIGKSKTYTYPTLALRIKEALSKDDRILDVHSFTYEPVKGGIALSFVVNTIFGDVGIEREVKV